MSVNFAIGMDGNKNYSNIMILDTLFYIVYCCQCLEKYLKKKVFGWNGANRLLYIGGKNQ